MTDDQLSVFGDVACPKCQFARDACVKCQEPKGEDLIQLGLLARQAGSPMLQVRDAEHRGRYLLAALKGQGYTIVKL